MLDEKQEAALRQLLIMERDDPFDPWINVTLPAEVMGCHEQDMRNMAQGGELPFKNWVIGNRVKVHRGDFLRFYGVDYERLGIAHERDS